MIADINNIAFTDSPYTYYYYYDFCCINKHFGGKKLPNKVHAK